MRLSLTILLCLFLVDCSENSGLEHIRVLDEIPEHIQEVKNLTIYPGDSDPLYEIELIPVQSFGETGEPYLTHIAGCVVDENERVIIWDIDPHGGGFPPRNSLYVYNPEGTYHTQIGRTGRGPGEFGMLTSIQTNDGNVFVLDHTNSRLNVFNTNDYSIERSTLVEGWSVWHHESVQNLGFSRLDTRNDGNHLAVFSEWVSDGRTMDYIYLLIDTEGDVLNPEPLIFPAGFTITPNTNPPGPSMSLPFMGSTITALSGEDALFTAWTQDFLIKKYDADGMYQSAIYYPVTGSSFDLNDHIESSRYNQRDIRNAFENRDEDLPES